MHHRAFANHFTHTVCESSTRKKVIIPCTSGVIYLLLIVTISACYCSASRMFAEAHGFNALLESGINGLPSAHIGAVDQCTSQV